MEKTRTTAEVANSAISVGTMPLTVNRNARIRERILSGEPFQLKSERGIAHTYTVDHIEKDVYTLSVERFITTVIKEHQFYVAGFAASICILGIRQNYSVFYDDVVFVNQSRKGGCDE